MKDKETILIIDDVLENLAILFDVLIEGGFEVLVAESGQLALERMDVLQPDLILLDVKMPDLSGMEVCRRLKSDETTKHIPVIFMTALRDSHETIAGFRAGAVDYVHKPLNPEEVLARVGTHLQLRSLHRDLEIKNRQMAKEVTRRRQAEQRLERTLPQAILVVNQPGEVQFATHQAWRMIETYFPDHQGQGLPPAILQWLAQPEDDPFRLEMNAGIFTATKTLERGTGPGLLILMEEYVHLESPFLLEKLGLTTREAEILFWLAQGKTSPEIGIILQIAANTVKKHAQHIYAKLGVLNRTEAALRAMELLRSEAGSEQYPV